MKFADGLTIAFIVLRLCGVIDWSWIWVVSPLWVSLLVAVAIAIVDELTKPASRFDFWKH